jgi:hypothetical protein
LQKEVTIQIGSYRLRDNVTKLLLPCNPIMKTVTSTVAESLAERVAILLVDCYRDYENSNKGGIENGNRTVEIA